MVLGREILHYLVGGATSQFCAIICTNGTDLINPLGGKFCENYTSAHDENVLQTAFGKSYVPGTRA